jgi:serine/threonine protein phosphatase 1
MVGGLRALVHGHQTTHKMRQLGNVFFIDTGGWLDHGHFTLLDLKRLVAL